MVMQKANPRQRKLPGMGENTTTYGDYTMKFDLKKLTLPQNFQDMPGAKKLWTKIPVRKPSKTEFFRVLGDDKYTASMAIIELKEENETYLIHPELYPDLGEFIAPVQVCVVMTRMGALLIWCPKLPQERRNAWHDTAMQAAELATSKWICMRANMHAGCYDILEATGKLPEPEFPTADLTFTRMLEIAFRDFYVDSLEHPLVKRLSGQV
jgi:hypothetical protein